MRKEDPKQNRKKNKTNPSTFGKKQTTRPATRKIIGGLLILQMTTLANHHVACGIHDHISYISHSNDLYAGTSTVCNGCGRRRNDAGEDGHLRKVRKVKALGPKVGVRRSMWSYWIILDYDCARARAPAAWCPTVSMLWPRSLVSKQHKRFCTPNLCTPNTTSETFDSQSFAI